MLDLLCYIFCVIATFVIATFLYWLSVTIQKLFGIDEYSRSIEDEVKDR